MSAATTESSDENARALARRVAELEALLAKATAFDLGSGMTIKACPVAAARWVVYRDEWLVLDTAGNWIHEPARRHHWTDEFLNRTRFASLPAAISAAENARRK